jgi:ferredoxin/flavodoxin
VVRTAICYFTGTGNTAVAAQALADSLPAEFKVELFNIELPAGTGGPPATIDHDMVGLGSPVHAFGTAVAFNRFVDRLGPGRGRSVFLFVTEGEDDGEPFARTARRLERRGWRVVGEFVYLMPANVGLVSEHGGVWDYSFLGWRGSCDSAGLLAACRTQAQADAAALAAGAARRHPRTARTRVLSVLANTGFRAGSRLAWLHLRAGAACTGCGRCEESCPTQSIRLVRGRPKFGPGCTVCTRCQQVCPVRAIGFSWPMSFLNSRVPYLAPGWSPPKHSPAQPV